MRIFPILFGSTALFATAVHAAPPRAESPVPRATLEAFGEGSSDETMAKAIAAASAYPLGTLQNPIRVGGPDGARRYVAQLRCPDGSTPGITREAPGSVGAYGALTTTFTLACRSGEPTPLVFDLYQEEYGETRPAPGFQLAR